MNILCFNIETSVPRQVPFDLGQKEIQNGVLVLSLCSSKFNPRYQVINTLFKHADENCGSIHPEEQVHECTNMACAPVLAALFMDELRSWIALLTIFSHKDKHEQSRIGA